MANEGNIIKTFKNNNLIRMWLNSESGLFGPEAVNTISIPTMPKAIELQINILVAIFSIYLLYQV